MTMPKSKSRTKTNIPVLGPNGFPREVHPLLAATGTIPHDKFTALAKIISEQDQPVHATIFEGKLIENADGYYAALHRGVPIVLREHIGSDPAAVVIGNLIPHWGYDRSQRAVVIARISSWRPVGRPTADDDGERLTAEQMAVLADVSLRLVEQAKVVVRHARTAEGAKQALDQLVIDGEISLRAAAAQIKNGAAPPAAVPTSTGPTKRQLIARVAHLEKAHVHERARAEAAEAALVAAEQRADRAEAEIALLKRQLGQSSLVAAG